MFSRSVAHSVVLIEIVVGLSIFSSPEPKAHR